MPLEAKAMTDIYDAQVPDSGDPAAGRIHPFIGSAFTTTPDALRVLALGVNAYCDDDATSKPAWFPAMFSERKYRFQKAVVRDVGILAAALTASPAFAGRTFLGVESVYHTNAVKRFLPASKGKKAHRVPEDYFIEGAGVFRAELEALAAAGALPDLVVVFGSRPWSHVWPAFRRPRPAWVTSNVTSPGDLFHHLNRVRVRTRPDEDRPLLLVKLRHPTGSRGRGMSASDLCGHADFQRALMLDGGGSEQVNAR
ncbi:MAG: hypothetical protein V4850_16385 [Myxococcota bacterium]